MTTRTAEPLLRLMHLVSPSLPVGGFTYSQGIEWAVETGWIRTAADLEAWLRDQLRNAFALVDLPILIRLCTAARDGDAATMGHWIDWLLASRETAELRSEEGNRGRALADLLLSWGLLSAGELVPRAPPSEGHRSRTPPSQEDGRGDCHGSEEMAGPARCSTPEEIAVDRPSRNGEDTRGSQERIGTKQGQEKDVHLWRPILARSQAAGFAFAAVGWDIQPREAALGYAWGWLENLVLAAVKLVPLGQTQGQQVLARLLAEVPPLVERALTADDGAIGAASPALAIASSAHETQYTRLFRS